MIRMEVYVENADEARRFVDLIETFVQERTAKYFAAIDVDPAVPGAERSAVFVAPVAPAVEAPDEPTDEQLYVVEIEAEYVAQPQAREVSVEEANAALARFASAKGIPAAKELLQQAGAARVSELTDGQRATFVGLVEEKLGSSAGVA